MKTYKKQQEALDKCRDDQFTFAVNYKNSKSCYFVNATDEEFWNAYMVQGERNNYEKIRVDKECHLFLDIDKKKTTYPGVDIEKIWNNIKYVIECAFENMLNIEKHRLNFIKLHSHSENKQSMHIIVKVENTIFKNIIHAGLFVKSLINDVEYPDVIDLGIYTKNRNFRMLGCTKAGEERYLLGEKPLSFEYWKETKIQPLYWDGPSIQMVEEDNKDVSVYADMPEKVKNIFVNTICKDKKLFRLTGELNLNRVASFPDSLTYVCSTSNKKCPFARRFHSKNVQYVVLNLLKCRYTLRCRSPKCRNKEMHFKMKDYLNEKICI